MRRVAGVAASLLSAALVSAPRAAVWAAGQSSAAPADRAASATAPAVVPFVPPPIVQGGQVVVLFPPGSHFLNMARVGEAEQETMQTGVPGRIQSIVNIHNPSIEFHPADPGINTGATVILAAGGGHTTLNVGTEGADFVPFFYNYGVNTVILRNRLRRDGYNPLTDEIDDAQQAIRTGTRAREGMAPRPEQDRDHGLFGGRGTGSPGGAGLR